MMKRDQFYSQIPQFWPDLYGDEYALYDVHEINAQEVDKIRLATERAGRIFSKVSHILRNVPDETFEEMGYPKGTWSFLRLKTTLPESVIARFDFIPYNGTYKCIELNADTPTFIKELFSINGKVCTHFQKEDPNANMEDLLKQTVQQVATGHVVFTAHVENIEDYYTALYLMEQLPGASFTPLNELQIERGIGLFDAQGKKIDVLYRQTYPIENAILDRDAAGNPIGIWLLELVEQGLLQIINPPSAFLLQNKAVQAVIWGLHEERSPLYTEQEHSWIAEYFLPSYLEAEPFIASGVRYVEKPVFGREGDTVSIYEANGTLDHAEQHRSYTQYPMLYQQYIEQPVVTFHKGGKQQGQLLIGSFLLNGQATAIGARVGDRITNNLSYYLPLGIEK